MSARRATARPIAVPRTDRLVCARPLVGKGSDPHAPKPRLGIDFDAIVTRSQKDVYHFIRTDSAAKKTKAGGYVNNNAPGYAVIARELRISTRTVARCVKALIAKGYMQAYEILARDGHRTGTRYVLPFWGKVWAEWRKDTRIAFVDGYPMVYGRGKRWMAPEEAATWGIRRYSGSQPAAPDEAGPEEVETEESPEVPELARPPDDELEVIRTELKNWCEEDPGYNDAWRLLEEAQKTDAETPPAAVADAIRITARTRRAASSAYKFTPGFFIAKMEGAAIEWREKARKQAQKAEKHGRWARDQRVNTWAAFIQELANPRPETPLVDLDWMREQIAAADPDERAEAEAALAGAQTRAAGG